MTPRPERRDVARALRRLKRRRTGRAVLLTLLVLLLAALALLATVFRPVTHTGRAMLPTLQDGDVYFVNTLRRTPDRGQAVLLSRIPAEGGSMVRRVIALPGDEVSFTEDGTLLLNGQPLEEPYAWPSPAAACDMPETLLIPEGRFFALGDNRAEALDSRLSSVGLFSLTEVLGTVWE